MLTAAAAYKDIMNDQIFSVGTFVTNSKVAEWGTGKVLAMGEQDRRRVFFEFGGERLMPGGVLVAVPELVDHPLFSHLDARTDLHGARSFLQMEQAFKDAYGQGFDDPKYLEQERDYKVAAATQMAELCSKQALSDLLGREDYAGVCDRAKRIVSKANLIFPNEKMALNDALKRGASEQRLFATRLFELLYGEGAFAVRFEAFTAALEELGALKWTTATYFPFLAQPERYPFVKPSYVQEAAKAYAFDLGYTPHPNWHSYARVMTFVRYVADALERRGGLIPHDFIDVQGFIWCTLHGPTKAGKATKAKAAKV
ncbi:MAG: hypothetical protein AUJ49_13155 [Desulfovibrionaceae bacterium CG1_02_65_16]|nr:MAG: hypothetical protein AUJ49_13155 [Desulfovibrionaceae bacterium CG1_02_65_16]